MGVEVAPIMDEDNRRIAEFLKRTVRRPRSVDYWACEAMPTWIAEKPNNGFMLVDGERIVGSYLAYYSTREIAGRTERFCNIATWCVQDDYRHHALRLLKALLSQDGYTFTDLTPLSRIARINRRFGLKMLKRTQAYGSPCLPFPPFGKPPEMTSQINEIEGELKGDALKVLKDHGPAMGARHTLIQRGPEQCYVLFRKDWRHKSTLCTVFYVSNPHLFRREYRHFLRHLLLQHGILACVVEQRIVSGLPMPGYHLKGERRKMFKSDTVADEDVDYLYSELQLRPRTEWHQQWM